MSGGVIYKFDFEARGSVVSGEYKVFKRRIDWSGWAYVGVGVGGVCVCMCVGAYVYVCG